VLNPFNPENQAPQSGILDAPAGCWWSGTRSFELGGPVFYRVVDIKPVLDPKVPPGTLQIDIAAAVHFLCPQGKRQGEFIRVRTAEEAGPNTMFKLDETKGEA
jgi:hypothetical protein